MKRKKKKDISRQTKAEIIFYQQTYAKRNIKKNLEIKG